MMKEDPSAVDRLIIPLDSFFDRYPPLKAGEDCMKKLQNGNPLPADGFASGGAEVPEGIYRIYDTDGNFLALYQRQRAEEYLRPYKMFL